MGDSGKGKTVALINPLWMGHHPVYFGHFTRAFLSTGARVIGLSPDPDAARREIAAAVRDIPDWEGRVALHPLRGDGRSLLDGRFESDPLLSYRRWQNAGAGIEEAEKACHWKVDLTFFPHLDAYLRFFPFPSIPARTIGRPWSGLYLRNHHHRSRNTKARSALHLLGKGDALLRSPDCLEIGVLDERFIDGMNAYTNKPVIAYPDITETLLPEQEFELAQTILAKAAGRKITGLIGLETRKGMLNMLRVALKAHEERQPWYFVFAGVFDREAYAADDLAFIAQLTQRIAAGELTNIHFDPEAERIPTEADFNALFSSFDVAWAAFEGFHGSSGTLSKAAAFQIPSVATAGECIGDRLENYRIGLTIPEGSSTQAYLAIQHLLDGKNWAEGPLDPDYQAFNEAHSSDRFNANIARLMAKV